MRQECGITRQEKDDAGQSINSKTRGDLRCGVRVSVEAAVSEVRVPVPSGATVHRSTRLDVSFSKSPVSVIGSAHQTPLIGAWQANYRKGGR